MITPPAAECQIVRCEGTLARHDAYYPRTGEVRRVLRHTIAGRFGGEPMRIELYRVIHWVAVAALVVWTVYSAYSAFIFS